MTSTAYRVSTAALLLVLAASFGLQRAARANEAGAVLGGILAGALVYEMLDDGHHDWCGHVDYYCYPRGYRPPCGRPWYLDPGYTVYYRDWRPPAYGYWSYDYPPRTYAYRYDYSAPRGYGPERAPSRAQRGVGPPPPYRRGGGRYAPPPRYRR